MIGTSTIIGKVNSNSNFDYLNIHPWLSTSAVFSNKKILSIKTSYKEYPYYIHESDNVFLSIEGFIYTLDHKIIQDRLLEIGGKLDDLKKVEKLLFDFLHLAEGDFIIQIINKKINKYIVFNDYISSLAFYYSLDNNRLLLSRTLKFILENSSSLSIDPKSIYQKLCFQYTLSNNTSFKNIKLLKPASYLYTDLNNPQEFKTKKIIDINFFSKEEYKDKEDAITDIANELILHTKKVVTYFEKNKYSIANTLSGGYDSRIILALLSKTNVKSVDNYTYEYIQDESPIARPLWELLQVPGSYTKLKFNNDISQSDFKEIQYNYDGKVSYYTNAVCHNDALFLRNSLPQNKYVIMNGFVGELLRKPYKCHIGKLSLKRICKLGLYGPYKETQLFNYKNFDFLKDLSNYKETKINDQLKHFYWEFLVNLVLRSGEDRHRTFNPITHPLLSRKVLEIIFHKIPLDWINFEFFTAILNRINPKALEIPIYGSDINLQSKSSIRKYDKSKPFPYEISNYKKIKLIFKDILQKEPTNCIDENLFNQYRHYSKFISETFNDILNPEIVHLHIGSFQRCTNTILSETIYFAEISSKYKDKIV